MPPKWGPHIRSSRKLNPGIKHAAEPQSLVSQGETAQTYLIPVYEEYAYKQYVPLLRSKRGSTVRLLLHTPTPNSQLK